MIQTISNFIDKIPPNYHTDGLKLKSGVYIRITLDVETDEHTLWQSILVDKKGIALDYVESKLSPVEYSFDFALRNYYSECITMNKPLDPKKKIHSTNPYTIFFKKENLYTFDDNLDVYFNECKKLIDTESEDMKIVNRIIRYSSKLASLIKEEPKIKNISEKEYIKIFFDFSIEKLIYCSEKYLANSLFSSKNYNKNSGSETIGLSGFLNGANSKKRFLLHYSTKFEVNNRISSTVARNLFLLEKLMKNKKIPYMLPIFIDKDELNQSILKVFQTEGNLSFKEILRKLFEDKRQDISNYYLINWSMRKGPILNDVDYVDRFEYNIEELKIVNVMMLQNIPDFVSIKNIFDFEMKVVQIIFNNFLIVSTKNDDVIYKYFDDLDSKYIPPVYLNTIQKYRKNFYDYIYKSRREALSGRILYEIIISHILDDLKRDTIKNGIHSKSFSIKEKLNILFSVAKTFNIENQYINIKGENNMASIIPAYQEKLRKLFNDDSIHIETNDEFAFDAGQLIYYILQHSQSANKTHALIEPFISKNDVTQFKNAISRSINQYKHSFNFGNRRFEKAASEVLGFDCTENIKNILPIILAGYFSSSLFFEKH